MMRHGWRRGGLVLAMAGVLSLGAGGPAQAQDPFDDIQKRFQERQRLGDEAFRGLHEEYRLKRQAMEGRWRQREQEIQARWEETRRAIEQKWEQAQRSSHKDWVEYSADREARSIVDFEQGTVEVTALVPASEVSGLALPLPWFTLGAIPSGRPGLPVLLADPPSPLDARDRLRLAALPAAWTRLMHQFEQIFAQEAQPGKAALAGQVAAKDGKPVDRHTVKAYLQEEVLPAAVAEQKPVESRDGVTRIKVTARVAMLPDHLRRRALQYQDLVPAYAKQHGLDPRLLFAMIHTESFFNPKAQSPSPTYGLMQLVPRGAARDAYNFLYKEDRVLDDEYLLDPAHNVELGAAYLRLLGKQLFAGLDDGDKKTALLLCAYKWGPGNTQAKILKQVRVQDLTETQVHTLLSQRTPEETRLYLKQVRDRMALYEDVIAPPAAPVTTTPAAADPAR